MTGYEMAMTVSLDFRMISIAGRLDLLAVDAAWQVTVVWHVDVEGVEKLLRRRSWAEFSPKSEEAEDDAEFRTAKVLRRAEECAGIATDRRHALLSAKFIRLTADPVTKLCAAMAAMTWILHTPLFVHSIWRKCEPRMELNRARQILC